MRAKKKLKKLKKEFAELGDAVAARTARHAALETEWREEVRTLEDELRRTEQRAVKLEQIIRNHFSPEQADKLINSTLSFERVSACWCSWYQEECRGEENLPKDEFCVIKKVTAE